MARLPELPARRVLAALRRAGFAEIRRRGSHRFLMHADGRSLIFALHDAERLAAVDEHHVTAPAVWRNQAYGVQTRVLNQAVRRNPDRFPASAADSRYIHTHLACNQ